MRDYQYYSLLALMLLIITNQQIALANPVGIFAYLALFLLGVGASIYSLYKGK